MGRLIDADAVPKEFWDYAFDGGKWSGCTIKDLLDSQPTVTPNPDDGWVLCSERMPEEHEWLGTKRFGTTISDEVYMTFENPEGERLTKHLSFQNGELGRYDKAFMDAWHKGAKPIAWMPLPKPFKGEK